MNDYDILERFRQCNVTSLNCSLRASSSSEIECDLC